MPLQGTTQTKLSMGMTRIYDGKLKRKGWDHFRWVIYLGKSIRENRRQVKNVMPETKNSACAKVFLLYAQLRKKRMS